MKKLLSAFLVSAVLSISFLFPVYAENTPTETVTQVTQTYDGFIETDQKPISNGFFTSTTSGGSRSLTAIHDGVMLPQGTTAMVDAFDSYVAGKKACEEYIGYEFTKTYTVKKLVFQTGVASAGGGWFVGGTLKVQVLTGDTWSDVESDIAGVYPQTAAYSAEAYPNYETYTITLSSPVACDGIRLIGQSGGTKYYFSCAELRVLAGGLTLKDGRFVENLSIPVCSDPVTIRSTTSGGSRTLATIRDGVIPGAGNTNGKLQYDNYHASRTGARNAYIGYEFPQSFQVKGILYTEGNINGGGGFFEGGVTVQILKNGEWTDVASDAATAYPSGGYTEHPSYASYAIDLEKPTVCEGIRLAGAAGGTKHYISCSEMRVSVTEAHNVAFCGTQSTEVADGKYNIRLVGKVDTLNCKAVGFFVTVGYKGNSFEVEESRTRVYEVYKNVIGGSEIYTAEELNGNYLFAFALIDVPADGENVTLEVTPYCIDENGTHLGTPKTVTYCDGVRIDG